MHAFIKAIIEEKFIELPDVDKSKAIILLSRYIDTSSDDSERENVSQMVLERERQAITYLGYGIACPHARSDIDGELQCAIGWSKEGISYGNDDGTPVKIILLYYVPKNTAIEYLGEISSLSRALLHNEKLHAIDNIVNIQEMHTLLLGWAQTIVKTSGTVSDHTDVVAKADLQIASRLLLPEILDMVRPGYLNNLRSFIIGLQAPEIAELISETSDDKHIILFRLLPRSLAEEVFSLLDVDDQNKLLEVMVQEERRSVILALPPDDRTALFEELPAPVLQKLLNLLNDKERKVALALLSYPEDSVGRLMTNRYVSVHPDWNVAQAMAHIRKFGIDSETISMIYITDTKGKLLDDLLLRKIILADPETKIADLSDGNFACLHSRQDREDAIHVFKMYDLHALPVIDDNGILLGIVTTDDILDVFEEEVTEDIQKGSAISPLGVEYLKAPIMLLITRRIVWLIPLVFVNVLSGLGISYFEDLIQAFVPLVIFLPLLIAGGGNAGSQAATLVTRSMALGEVELGHYLKAVGREVIVSIGLGITMGAAVFLLGWTRSGVKIGIVTSCAMISNVVLGSITGLSLPFILKKLGQDPAVASGPLVTSINDIVGVFVYLSIASYILL